MTRTNKYKVADNAALYFTIAFFGVIILLGLFWVIQIIQQVIINIFP